ncbi:MAG: ATP-binding cassette domain-containing protein, partial [Comamonas sp.]|nr:ATP-binding cassette domain-containing protein [Comamonas sp.]
MIETDKLRKTHGTTTVLHDVSLRIPQGQLTAIIGPNGAGKSTALSLISRLMPMSSGTVRIEGQDITTTASDALARVMAILRQDNQSALRLTVRDLVAFG